MGGGKEWSDFFCLREGGMGYLRHLQRSQKWGFRDRWGGEGQTEPRVPEVCAGPWGGRQVCLRVYLCVWNTGGERRGKAGGPQRACWESISCSISENLAGHGGAHL